MSKRKKVIIIREKKKKKTSNIILVSLALFALFFIVSMIVVFWFKGATPDTLIQYTLGAGGLEALLLAGIKISKVIKGETIKNEDDSEGDFNETDIQ